ncbi:GTP-binding protein [Tistrella mobilis]|uniref:Sulfate adenylyltransferase, large subunit n=1 Tax=Tistrella mobilis (strain KA081020-065) TaxID=1110502 RepID=I3TID8_TISMK|nr:GTP-binding protein [Tistrella mobilis]AFK52526.1 sulfate adenylyltransferase, large subunit [Tistrella mobilis KA081020-065]
MTADTLQPVLAEDDDLRAAIDRRLMRIVIVGHVDHGKSTLVGRLLNDSGSLPEGRVDAIRAMSERRGMPFEWSFVMDALKAERDQGITIDSAQIWFKSARRDYVIIDAPGHKEFLKNMITGAAAAEAAVLVIDAAEGVREQSRRHGYLLHLLGLRQIAVVVNKMDLVGYDQARYDAVVAEYTDYLAGIGVTATYFGRWRRARAAISSSGRATPCPGTAARPCWTRWTVSYRPRRLTTGRCACRCRMSINSTSAGSSSAGSKVAGWRSAIRSWCPPPTRPCGCRRSSIGARACRRSWPAPGAASGSPSTSRSSSNAVT